MTTWMLILLTVVSGSIGDVLSAKGMASGGELTGFRLSGLGRILAYIVTRRLVILGIACYAVGFFSLLALLSVAELSIAVPATALSFVLDTLGAWIFLGEKVHWRRWVGVLLVAAGVLLTVDSGHRRVSGATGLLHSATMPARQHSLGSDEAR